MFNDLGALVVVSVGTENPYTRPGLTGDERVRTLGLFLRGRYDQVKEWDFWIAPSGGGAKKVTTAEEANINPLVVDYYWIVEGKSKRDRLGRLLGPL